MIITSIPSPNKSTKKIWEPYTCECGIILKFPSENKIEKHSKTKRHIKIITNKEKHRDESNSYNEYFDDNNLKPREREFYRHQFFMRYLSGGEPCPFCGYPCCDCGSGY